MDKKYVLELLKKKKEADPECKAFGAKYHKYNLLPPIEENKLVLLEKEFDISLPDDYRKFILTIGNGGAGPSYGLYSVQGALGGYDLTYRNSGPNVKGLINKDFISPSINVCLESEDCGLLILCQHGCANDDFLIVSGSEKSYVWEYIEWAGCHVPLLRDMPDLLYVNKLPENERVYAEAEWVKKLLNADCKEKMTFEIWYSSWLETCPL